MQEDSIQFLRGSYLMNDHSILMSSARDIVTIAEQWL